MTELKGQERLDKIEQLNGAICSLRHELDGVYGYPEAGMRNKVADRIEMQLLVKEIILCAAERGSDLDDDEVLRFIQKNKKALETAEELSDILIKEGLIPKLTRRVVTTVVKQGICPICGNTIELDELLPPFITQFPEVFRYHCPACGTTGTQTITSVQNYPVQHSDVIDGAGCLVTIKEPKPKAEPTIPVSVVKNYLVGLLDEWNKLGDRKYELPNMQVYNHIRKELDDLSDYCKQCEMNDIE